MLPTDSLREYLKENGFYYYRSHLTEISDGFLNEYKIVADKNNKRNLSFQKKWEEFKSFGPSRRIIVIDLGGTNLNLFDVSVRKGEKIKISKIAATSFYEDKVYTPEILFSDLKKEIDKFIPEHDKKGLENVVFIFSYPLIQTLNRYGYIDAVCTNFIKEHKSKGIIDLEVGSSFQDYLRQNGYPRVNICVTNDTPIHVLSAKAYEILNNTKYDIAINVIVGTGCNISTAYNEKNLRIINTEFGNFRTIELSKFDKELDKKASIPGIQLNEKMISGAYQHDLLKIIIKNMIADKILPENVTKGLDLDRLSSGEIEKKLRERKMTEQQEILIGFLWKEINKRGGAICGIFLGAVINELHKTAKKDNLRVIIMETGSVIGKNQGFRESLLDTLDSELGRLQKNSKIQYNFRGLENQAAYGAIIFESLSSPK